MASEATAGKKLKIYAVRSEKESSDGARPNRLEEPLLLSAYGFLITSKTIARFDHAESFARVYELRQQCAPPERAAPHKRAHKPARPPENRVGGRPGSIP